MSGNKPQNETQIGSHVQVRETNNIGRRSEELGSERASNMEESSYLCCEACKQMLPPLDDDLRVTMRRMELDNSTENILRLYGI